MAGRSPILSIKVIADTLSAQAGLKGLGDTAGGVGSTVKGLAIPAGIALGAITVFGKGAVDAASEVEQSFGGLESVFGDTADQAKELARSSAKDVGLATSDYANLATVLGSQLKNMGTSAEDLVPATDKLIDLGADLAATYGGTTADAVAALSSLLRGERDPIEKYGVGIKQADVNARLAAEGLTGLTGEQLKAAEANATLAILAEQTAAAQGAFARETDTAAHAQQVANAQWENAQAALGEALLPVVVLVSEAIGALSVVMTENKDLVLIVVGVIGGLAVAILAVNAAMAAMRAVTAIATAAQWALNAALMANPIGLVVLAIAALIAAFVLAYQNSETFRRIVDGVFQAVVGVVRTAVDAIRRVFDTLAGILRGPWELMQRVVDTVVRAIRGAIESLSRFVRPILDGIKAGIRFISDGIASVRRAIDNLPDLPRMPWDSGGGRSAPPAVRGTPQTAALMGVSGFAGGGGNGRAARFPTVNLVLDREIFGRAVVSGLRRYDRRNGSAQVLPKWS